MSLPTKEYQTTNFTAILIGADTNGSGQTICKQKSGLKLHCIALANSIDKYIVTIGRFATTFKADANGDLLVDLADMVRVLIPSIPVELNISDSEVQVATSIALELGEFDTLNLGYDLPNFPNKLQGIDWGAVMIGQAVDIEGAEETPIGSGVWVVNPPISMRNVPLIVSQAGLGKYPIIAEVTQCGEKTAFLKWRERFSGKFKQHSWRIVDSTLESGKVVMLDDVLSPFTSIKGVSESLTLEIDGLTREGIRYYSDIILSDDVYCVTDVNQEFTELDRVLVTNKSIKLPEQGYEFGSIEVTIKAVENDAL